MLNFQLDKQELAELRAAHRRAKNAREAYRINAVILLGDGWKAADVASALLINADTVRTYFKRYKAGGLEALLRMNYVTSHYPQVTHQECWLSFGHLDAKHP